MATIVEGTFTLPDGFELYQKTWKPASEPVAHLIHVHGNSDHINRYNDFFPLVAAHGILVTGIDQRGWGRSIKDPSQKGDTGLTSQVLSELAAFIESQFPAQVPVFLMGHSMGGGEVLALASTPEYAALVGKLRGILLESPYIALVPGQDPSLFTQWAGRISGFWFPKHQLHYPIAAETCTRHPPRIESLKQDELCHGTGTLEMFGAMMERAAALSSGTYVLSEGAVKSLWLAHGTGDLCTSHDASEEWLKRASVQDKVFKSYDGWSHQLHADLPGNDQIFADDCAQWMLERV